MKLDCGGIYTLVVMGYLCGLFSPGKVFSVDKRRCGLWIGTDSCVKFHHVAQKSVHLKSCGLCCALFSGNFHLLFLNYSCLSLQKNRSQTMEIIINLVNIQEAVG